MKLKLNRPLIIFDGETTGTNVVTDRLVEIGMMKVFPDDRPPIKRRQLVNPGIVIPPEAIEVHKITNEMVHDKPTFASIAPKLYEFMKDCDLCGQNISRFDIVIFSEEFARCGIEFPQKDVKIIDTLIIDTKKRERKLEVLYQLYTGKVMEGMHTALADSIASFEVLLGQLEAYPDLAEMTFDELAEYSKMNNNVDLAGKFAKDDQGIIIFTFGKHINKPVVQAFKEDPGYNKWIQEHDFTQNTKQVSQKMYDYVQSKKKK